MASKTKGNRPTYRITTIATRLSPKDFSNIYTNQCYNHCFFCMCNESNDFCCMVACVNLCSKAFLCIISSKLSMHACMHARQGCFMINHSFYFLGT